MKQTDTVDIDMAAGEFGDRAILEADLTIERVPAPGAPFWMEVAEFALSFDGYQYLGSRLGTWANTQVDDFNRTGQLDQALTLPDLRALLFYEQRRYRHFDGTPTGSAAHYVDALLAAIRSCLEAVR